MEVPYVSSSRHVQLTRCSTVQWLSKRFTCLLDPDLYAISGECAVRTSVRTELHISLTFPNTGTRRDSQQQSIVYRRKDCT